MPSSILSHQGIVLPLKIKYPERFDGTALCVGSFAPDLAMAVSYFYEINVASYTVFHSVGGLVYVVPISLLLVVFFDKAFFPAAAFLAARKSLGLFSQWLVFFGLDEYHVQKKKKHSLRWFVKATYSVLVGILSHFLLDLPTHGQIPYLSPFYSGKMPEWFLYEYSKTEIPFFGVFEVTNYNLLWIFFSIVFGLLALHSMRYIKKHRLLQKWYSTNNS